MHNEEIKITNNKYQMTNKYQISMFKSPNLSSCDSVAGSIRRMIMAELLAFLSLPDLIGQSRRFVEHWILPAEEGGSRSNRSRTDMSGHWILRTSRRMTELFSSCLPVGRSPYRADPSWLVKTMQKLRIRVYNNLSFVSLCLSGFKKTRSTQCVLF